MIILFTFVLLFIKTSSLIFDFSTKSSLDNWRVVNDGVMGGLSEGQLFINPAGNGVFAGEVKLENNGGFTSIRLRFDQKAIVGKQFAVLRLRGDGKRYQFRAKTNVEDWFSYIYYFDTQEEWETVRIPLHQMTPSYRGRQLSAPNFPAKALSEIAILIANKEAEKFQLEIDYIGLE